MQFIILISYLLAMVMALPVDKRFYRATSPMFSLIAHHKGAVFQYHLVKFDGDQLVLNADEQAFFGRIKANSGYTLNIPSANSSNATISPSTESVYINENHQLLSTKSPLNATTNFGIEKSLLTYQGSNKFVACPEVGYRGEYGIYFQGNNTNTTQICPRHAHGYEIQLMVQVDATVNYTPKTNVNSAISYAKRMLYSLIGSGKN